MVVALRAGELVIGETIGNFKLLSRLGRGGMGEVYLAEHASIQTKVAVKVLHPEISRDTGHVQRFFNEARIVGRIKHAGIVKIFDVGFFHDHAYLIMELLEGESLAARLERCGRMPASQLANLGRQIASTLDATHRAGVTHRDLKPDNIFLVVDEELAARERVKILDFGIAKLTGTLAVASPKTQGTMGTPTYMAPEQWGDSAQVDWRADVYSLGCVVYEMACGQPPFVATTIAEAYAKHLTEAPAAPRSRSPDLPPAFETLILRLLAKQPEDRAVPMAEIVRAFEALVPDLARGEHRLAETLRAVDRSSSAATRTTLGASVGQVTARAASPRRHVAMIAIVGVACVSAGVLATMQWSGGSTAPPPPHDVAIASTPPAAAILDAAPAVADRAAAAPLQPTEVVLRVDSHPAGADVFRLADGVRVGTTPVSIAMTAGSGELVLVFKKAGFRDARVSLPIDASLERTVELVKPALTPSVPTAAPTEKHTTPRKPVRKKGDVSDNPYEDAPAPARAGD